MLLTIVKVVLGIIILLAVVMMLMFVMKGQASRQGTAAGMSSGLLAACPDSPNCASSEAGTGENHLVEPLSFSPGDGDKAWRSAIEAIKTNDGVITGGDQSYTASVFTSSVFGFVDDVELRMDEASSRIQIRSASREGYSDMGANAKRVRQIRLEYNKLMN